VVVVGTSPVLVTELDPMRPNPSREATPAIDSGMSWLDGRVVGMAHGRDESTVVLADGRIVNGAVIVDASDPPVLVNSIDRSQRVVGIGRAAAQTEDDGLGAVARLATAIGDALDRGATPAAISRAAWDAVRLPSWRSRLLRR
jgi:hypothetical protein